MADVDVSDMSDVIARVRKLLALSKSANQHEAQLAFETASRMLAAHRLTWAEVVERKPVERDFLKPDATWEMALLQACAAASGALMLLGTQTRTCRLLAWQTEALDAAQAMYETLRGRLPRLADDGWRAHVAELTDPYYGVHPSLREPGAEDEWRASFLLGVALGLAQKVPPAQAAAADEASVALVRITQPVDELRTWATQTLKATSRGIYSGSLDTGAFKAGTSTGREL